MNILAVNGSGRPFGNNYNILKSSLEILDNNNYKTELIQLTDLNIGGCKSCYQCKRGSDMSCHINDDMTPLLSKIQASDLLILSSPVYMWQVSAGTKSFVERLYPFYHFDKPSDLRSKKLVLIFTQAAPDVNLFKGYFEQFKASMQFLGFEIIDTIVMAGVRNPEDYKDHPEIVDEIVAAGQISTCS